jgi:2,5-diamino-6-(ribosylamino)-4(3H)-pyrimidinone 5'-phosphate reductase
MTRPYVQINVAMTADGKIDTVERKGALISSPSDKDRVDELRAASDLVMVGGHTLLSEDPRLTVKSTALRAGRVERGQPPNPAKAGVVTIAEFKPGCQFLTAGPAKVYVFTTTKTSPSHIEFLRAQGVEVFIEGDDRVDLESMLSTLADEGVQRILVEGGGILNFELIRQKLVDRITIYLAPRVFGGFSAPTLADGSGLPFSDAVSLLLDKVENYGDGGILLNYHLP